MSKRRSLGEAIDLSPEKLAFIGARAGDLSKPAEEGKPDQTSVSLEPPPPAETRDEFQALERSSRPAPRRQSAPQPAKENSSRLVRPVVSLTSRFPPELVEALRKASLERKLKDLSPSTVQEILEEALEDWLKRNGHF